MFIALTTKIDMKSYACFASPSFSFVPLVLFQLPKAMVHDPENLELWLKVDGETRQKDLTKDMIFKVPYLISYISSIVTLYEGDVILTGTPEGVGPVKIGQKITVGITGLSEVQFDVDRRVKPLS
ncbi:unnamed protein product [Eruca vesicaria subsp. sativa]|uniref:Fumarylacetoacetase-like C-terminal domain-containing protein n=1 Tax=Eruca vesicaria subsp. sativa TaxID=29727 RepID=A0ABC8KNP5_ERUVS|nr:unnamed protein product [Eruca vesicaria subsp. sativa]